MYYMEEILKLLEDEYSLIYNGGTYVSEEVKKHY